MSLNIAYTATNYGAADTFPHELAVDAAGNVWAANGNNFLVKFTPVGVGSSVSSSPLTQPNGVAIDNAAATGGTATVYVAGYANGVIGRFNASTGAYINDYAAGTSVNAGPAALSIDKSGNIWTANYLESTVGMQTSTATTAAKIYTSGTLAAPVDIATDNAGNLYLSDYGDSNLTKFTSAGVGSVFNSACGGGGGDAVAVDNSNKVWCANYQSLIAVSGSGSPNVSLSFTNTGEYQDSVALDGSSNVWTAAEDNNGTSGEIYEFDNSGNPLNSSTGFSLPAYPVSLAIDGSGNVWYTVYNSNVLHELIGVAVPVATPLAYGAANGKLGARP